MAKGGGGQDSNLENVGIILIIVVLLAIWGLSQIFWVYATFWKWLRVLEVGFFAFLIPDSVEHLIGFDFEAGLRFLLTSDPDILTAEIISKFDNLYLCFFNWLPGLIICFYGFKLHIQGGDIAFSGWNMENILPKMAPGFKHVKDFIGKHPEKTPLDFYPDDPDTYEYSMAMGERQFATCVPPVGLANAALKDKRLNRPIWVQETGAFDEELARKAFDSQLGPMYAGYNNLDEDAKRITDLLIDKILVKRDEVLPYVQDYLKQAYMIEKARRAGKKQPSRFRYKTQDISHKALADKLMAFVKEQMDAKSDWRPTDSVARSLCASPSLKGVLQQVVADEKLSKHAFVSTGLMTLLEAAREGATLPPLILRWLKGRNRPLWYAISNVGKKTAWTESSGTWAHWLLETECGFAVPYPETTEAIEGLRVALGLTAREGQTQDHSDEMWEMGI